MKETIVIESVDKSVSNLLFNQQSHNFNSNTQLFIEDIFLSHNRLTGTIPETIFDIQSLQQVYMGHNYLSGKLSTKLGSLPMLKMFNVSHNGFVATIPNETFYSTSLESLDLSYNNMWGELSSSFRDLKTLRHLFLHKNDFDGTIPVELGECNLSKGFMSND